MTILIGQMLNNDDRSPTNTQLLALPKAPAVLQVNVMVGSGDDKSWNTINLTAAKVHLNAGGTLIVCAHFTNPYSSVQNISSAWVSDVNASKPNLQALVSGTAAASAVQRYRSCQSVLTSFLQALPLTGRVIMRLFHEAGGTWFWWGRDNHNPMGSEAGVKALFADVRANCLIARPNTLFGFSGAMSWYSPIEYGYPGSQYVDYVGASLYSSTMTFANTRDWAALSALGKPVVLFEMGPNDDGKSVQDGNVVDAFFKAHPTLFAACFWNGPYSILSMTNQSTVVGDPNLGWLVPSTPTVAAVNVLGSFTSLSAAKAAFPNATFTTWPLPSAPNS